ncbi:MAG: c-type cytochrome [Elusimicrobia bacterium]|nr:c-type cytochrome [Elusimicrobiota bacterium]
MHRKLFVAFNVLLVAAFVWSLAVDYKKDWRDIQAEYFKKTAAAYAEKAKSAKDPKEAETFNQLSKAALREPIMIRQIIAKDLNRIDRCITCHVGMDEFVNPTLTTPHKEHPFTGHPKLGEIVKNHTFQKYGCSVCHAGQGLATSVEAAHGKTENWEKPLAKGALLQASCAKCHMNFQSLKGAEMVAKGRDLFEKHGCIGCHSLHGVGGAVSVDLGNIADKPLERIAPFNLSLIKTKDGKPLPKDDWKLPAWIEAHLTNVPMSFIPNDPHAQYNKEPIAPSGMPDFTQEIKHEGADAITAYLLSMSEEENIPHKYHVIREAKPEPKFASAGDHGKFVFKKYGCAACHGLEGVAGRRNYNAMGAGQPALDDVKADKAKLHEAMAMGREPTLPDVLGTYTREELKKKIQDGVPGSQIAKYNPDGPTPPLYMPAWKDRIKGQELEDLITWLLSIAKKQESW